MKILLLSPPMEKKLEIETLKSKVQLYEIEKKPYSKFPTMVKS